MGIRDTDATGNDREASCCFCYKARDHVDKLIAGPAVFICNECVGLCQEILEEDRSVEGSLRGVCCLCWRDAERETSMLVHRKLICARCQKLIRSQHAGGSDPPASPN